MKTTHLVLVGLMACGTADARAFGQSSTLTLDAVADTSVRGYYDFSANTNWGCEATATLGTGRDYGVLKPDGAPDGARVLVQFPTSNSTFQSRAPAPEPTANGWRGAGAGRADTERQTVLDPDLVTAIQSGQRPNLLFVGTSDTTDAAVAILRPHLRTPIYDGPDAARPAPHAPPTLLLHEVATLPLDQQHALCMYLNHVASGETQVVSTTTVDVFPLVEQGRFLAALYYRLNTLRFDASEFAA
jgi:hypothetical protein